MKLQSHNTLLNTETHLN